MLYVYVCVVCLAQYGSARAQPRIIAAVCTLLTLVGGMFASSQDIPQWTGIVDRLIAVAVIWGLLEFDIPLRRGNGSLPRRCDLDIVPEHENARQVQALKLRLVNAAESERRALSRELHDRVGQNLTALNFSLYRLCAELPKDASYGMRECARESLQLVEATAESIGDVMAELRPPVLDRRGILGALGWYANLFARRTRINVTVSGHEPTARLSPDVEVALYRIAQEALTNVAKHASARNASIHLRFQKGRLSFTVADDGAGFAGVRAIDPDESHWGIVTMRERAQAAGGTLRVESLPGSGTCVIVEVEHPL